MTAVSRWKVHVLRMVCECPLKTTELYNAANFYLKDGSFTLNLIPLLDVLKSGITISWESSFLPFTSNLFHKCVDVATSKPSQFCRIFPWVHVKSMHIECPVRCDSEHVPDEGALG